MHHVFNCQEKVNYSPTLHSGKKCRHLTISSVGENVEPRELITARKGANGHNLANRNSYPEPAYVSQTLECVHKETHTRTCFM